MDNMHKNIIVLTGGGTAGHVTPNIALLPILKDNGYEIHYIGTCDGIEKSLISKFDYVTYHEIPAGKLRRYFSLKNITDIFRVFSGISRAKKLMKAIRPTVVFSKGGFVSVPVVIAGSAYAPCVAHESDYSPGLANKISKRYTKTICTTFEETAQEIGKKAIHTGTPIRSELFTGDAEVGRQFAGISNDKPIILVMGGSLGAAAINNSIREGLDELLTRFSIIHICGKGKCDAKYSRDGYVQYEYVHDELKDIFAAADLVISRAGANSVFEFLALKKPTLFIPLPSKSSRGDQILNAGYMERHGYSMTMAQENVNTKSLYDAIIALYDNREKYIEHMEKAEHFARHGNENVLKVIFEAENSGR